MVKKRNHLKKAQMTRWLETIELRSPQNQRQELENTFKNLADELAGGPDSLLIKIYHNRMVTNDFCVHLHYSQKPDDRGSPLGLSVVSLLKEFGLVNHMLWEERTGKWYNKKKTSNLQRDGNE
jgi:hypothetical protein